LRFQRAGPQRARFGDGHLICAATTGRNLVSGSAARRLFAPALTVFGVEPHKVIFISLTKDRCFMGDGGSAEMCGAESGGCEIRELNFF